MTPGPVRLGEASAERMKSDAEGMGLIRIEAASYREALRQIGERFGTSVSIVSTRKIRRKGVLGMLGATGIEVYVTDLAKHQAFLEHRAERIRGDERGSGGAAAGRAGAPPAAGASDAVSNQALAEMLVDLRRQVQTLMRGAPQPPKSAAERAAAAPALPKRPAVRATRKSGSAPAAAPVEGAAARGVHPILEEARLLLDRSGFSLEAARDLLERLAKRNLPEPSAESVESRTLARLFLGELIRPRIPPCVPIGNGRKGGDGKYAAPWVVALVGPTGVGKTTTIAKLASHFQLGERKRVGLVTLDTYRIGAIDQLRKFSEILGVPFRVVEQGERVQEALDALRDCDLVLVDTAGRSQRDATRLAEVRDMLTGIGSLEIHLCASLATSRETILEVANNFRLVHYNRLIITKLDESARHGVLYDLFQTARIPVSYITCGQEVPSDIHAASVERLESLLLGD